MSRFRLSLLTITTVLLFASSGLADDLFNRYGWQAEWVTYQPSELHGDIVALAEMQGGLYATSENGDLYLYDFEQDTWHDLFGGRNGAFAIGPHPVMIEPNGEVSAMLWETEPGARRSFPRRPYGDDKPWWRTIHNAANSDKFYDGATVWSRRSDHEWRILDSLNSFSEHEVLLPDIVLVGDRYVKKGEVAPLLLARAAFESDWREIAVPGRGSIRALEMVGENALFTRGSAIYLCLPFSPYGPGVSTVLANDLNRSEFVGLKRFDRGYVAWNAKGEIWYSDNGIQDWTELRWELPYDTKDVVTDGSSHVWALDDTGNLYVYEWYFRPGSRWIYDEPVDVTRVPTNALRYSYCLLDDTRLLVGGRSGRLSQLVDLPYQRDWVRYADYDRYNDGQYGNYYDRNRRDKWYDDDYWRHQSRYRDHDYNRYPGNGYGGGSSGGGGGSYGGGDDKKDPPPPPPKRRVIPREAPEPVKKQVDSAPKPAPEPPQRRVVPREQPSKAKKKEK